MKTISKKGGAKKSHDITYERPNKQREKATKTNLNAKQDREKINNLFLGVKKAQLKKCFAMQHLREEKTFSTSWP